MIVAMPDYSTAPAGITISSAVDHGPGTTSGLPIPQDMAIDIGVVLRDRPAHIGAKTSLHELYPVVEITRNRWQISLDDGGKYSAATLGPVTVGPVLEYRQSFNDHLPSGAHHMPDAFETGGFAVYKTPLGDVEARLRKAINSYQGWSGDLSFDTGGHITPTTGVGLEIRAGWADNSFSNQFFGLRPRAAYHVSLPRFLPNNYYTLGAELTAGHKITPTTTAFIQSSLDRVYGEAWRSPILKTRDVFVLSLGLTWHLGRHSPDSI
ncbi:MipA/OmpV family protein [Asticcacaulis benevestitus]|uniref:TonB-dependent receptor-like beta-barrel domain-containing protein n=1 Tax=Asticcacaulis benevestitus DSM 16100 = ATCC BAA-896 TaxID=1121022 RepID=V4R853_9CAUL|nr:MipA/OmpV family protein [Asticcacaulis benevestitus]ESQ87603.1 hypothetical protein ABENE_17200 [Asticcacaulis benevestitus DSM 16100 = ATCC BAA-896]